MSGTLNALIRVLVAITFALVSPLREERLHCAAKWRQDRLGLPASGGAWLTVGVVGLLQVAFAVPWVLWGITLLRILFPSVLQLASSECQ